MANEVLNDDLRYGISALDTIHRDVAEPDELLVQSKDGKMFYKRADGQIVTSTHDYDRKTLMSEIINYDANLNIPNNAYVSYHTIDISGKSDFSQLNRTDIGSKEIRFKIPNGTIGFFIRVRGNELTNTAVYLMRSNYTEQGRSDENSEVTLISDIYAAGVSSEMEINCNFNELSHVALDSDAEYEVALKSIQYPKLGNEMRSLTQAQLADLIHMNMDNLKFEACTIDLVTFITDVASLPIYCNEGQVSLKMLFPMETLIEESHHIGSGGIVLSETQPDYPCLWAKPVK